MKLKLEPLESKDIIYDLYGIFVDYLIDTNLFMAPDNTFKNFQNWKKWYVAKVEIKGKAYLIVDIDLNRYSYCNYCKLGKRILTCSLNSKDAVEELKAYSKLLGIKILNPMKFYISGEDINYEFEEESVKESL